MITHLYRTPDRSRWFLVPADSSGPPGTLLVEDADGTERSFHPLWMARYEVDEAAGRQWAQAQLGDALDEIRGSIDGKLSEFRAKLDELKASPVVKDSPYTADAIPALGALLKALPGMIGGGVSGEADRRAKAGETATAIAKRLRAAGIEVGESLTAFPGKMASIREEAEEREK